MVLEHLVVAKAARADKLEQATLDDILRYGAQELFAEDTDTPAAAAAAAAAGPDGQQPAGQTVTQQQQQQQRKLRIVWDDDALDRLLDRSQLDTLDEAAAEAEEEEDDFSKAFKVGCVAVKVL
jgi:chromodomain-helicase-DNA-binding protein 4